MLCMSTNLIRRLNPSPKAPVFGGLSASANQGSTKHRRKAHRRKNFSRCMLIAIDLEVDLNNGQEIKLTSL